jgi:hypothetical protein
VTTSYRCKECQAEFEAYEAWTLRPCCDWQSSGCPQCPPEPPKPAATRRPAPHPGSRCSTHWRQEVRRRKAENHEKRVQKTYGLAKGEYAQLYDFQGGRCALCRRSTGASRKLSVDHCHASGEVRGELCRPCNSFLGHARDSIEFFTRCIRYLEHPPYARMKAGDPFYE